MQITREYLETQLADLTRQAEQAAVTLHNANGAIAVTKHLLEVLETKEVVQSPDVSLASADAVNNAGTA